MVASARDSQKRDRRLAAKGSSLMTQKYHSLLPH
jgi:hypothetical protein